MALINRLSGTDFSNLQTFNRTNKSYALHLIIILAGPDQRAVSSDVIIEVIIVCIGKILWSSLVNIIR